MSEFRFRLAFVLGPFMFCSLVPTAFFGSLTGEWGSNVIWGSAFGLGWCLSAFATGYLVHNSVSTTIGLFWGWIVIPILLHLSSGWLWRRGGERFRVVALTTLVLSLFAIVPAHVIVGWDHAGIHLPDWAMHLAESF